MRRKSCLGGCVLALGLGVNVASADVVTVNLTAHVTRVNDSSLPIVVGQPVTATYSYDTLTLSAPPPNPPGTYYPSPPPASVSVSVGGQIYQAQGNAWIYQITVLPTLSPTPASFAYTVAAPYVPPGPPPPVFISINFNDTSGQWLLGTALPTTAPPFTPNGSIFVQPAGGSSGFVALVDSATLVPSVTISPASSSFVAQQNFDAVVLLSSQIGITSLQASVGGFGIPPLSYPGMCQLAPANNAGRTAVVCPNASAVLANLGGGPVTINWQVTLTDGSTVQQSVTWTLVR
jgi:hypothetical protein